MWRYDWQAEQDIIDVHSEANWVGCKRSRKSSSGGTIAFGTHLITSYAKTQAVVAKSSEESELYAVIRASTEALGVSFLVEVFGSMGFKVRVGMGLYNGGDRTKSDTLSLTCYGSRNSKLEDCSH